MTCFNVPYVVMRGVGGGARRAGRRGDEASDDGKGARRAEAEDRGQCWGATKATATGRATASTLVISVRELMIDIDSATLRQSRLFRRLILTAMRMQRAPNKNV